ncbi:tryptophan 2-monooxygenase [Saccharothrix tamanrassetensis]|uniref:Tryptophan 2-monooxygenase n=1 Tax=Saccharothrix tamanrassetensis TaxID=1051531 RepID=A0A841CDH6_9PSEU|nr:amidohydrolase family protein [Saccharothrix tamanrassetensis]MBB5954217.1 tryptophan 2-monooxygenase [Saccharothrix tamanrassetensis]
MVVTDGVIADVGPHVPVPPGARVVELDGHTLLPGLIDAHVHCATNPTDGRTSAGTDSSRQLLGAIPALNTLLHNGFTTVRDLGCHIREPITVSLRDAVEAGIVLGPSMVVAPHIMSSRAGHGDESTGLGTGQSVELGALADGVDSVLARVRAEVRAGADWIKFAASGGFTSSGDSPEDIGYSQPEMDALVAAAGDFNRPCAAHALGDRAVRRAVEAGVRSIEHGLLASAETLALIERRGVFIVPTVYAATTLIDKVDDDQYWRTQPSELRDKLARYADPMLAALRRIARSDARIAFGTDAGVFPHEENRHEFAAMVHHGFTPERVLHAATTVAADLLAMPDRGCVHPGARADLVAVPGNPFDDIEVMEHVDFVMRHGRVVRSPGADP